MFIILSLLYIIVGAALGGLYYYLAYKDCHDDLEDMHFIPIWIAVFWPFVAPLAFAIYIAKRAADDELNGKG